MEFPFPSWAFFCAALALIVAIWIGIDLYKSNKKTPVSLSVPETIKFMAIVSVIAYTVLNCILYFILAEDDPGNRVLTNVAVAEELHGFTPGEVYPAAVGTTGESMQVSGSGYHVFLYGSFTVEGSNSSYVRMSIERAKGVSNIIELPISKIDFIQKPDIAPSVSIDLHEYDAGARWANYEWQGARYERHITWGWWTRELIEPGRITRITSEKSLQEIISQDAMHVTVTLTPEEYLSILDGTTVRD